MNTFESQMRQYEIAEARKKMGMPCSTASGGFTSMSSQTSGGMTSGNTANLNNSSAVGYNEIQNAKQKMNKFNQTY